MTGGTGLVREEGAKDERLWLGSWWTKPPSPLRENVGRDTGVA